MDQVAFNGGEMNIENFTRKRLIHTFTSPFTIIGLIVIGTLILMSIFAQEISGYSKAEVNGFYAYPFAAPSSEHLLGTTQLGRDVFARILYSIRYELIFGLIVLIFGLIFGSILGVVSSLHKYANMAIGICLIGLIIIPFPIIILMFLGDFRRNFFIPIIIIGLLLIPIYTRIIAYVPFNKRNIKISFQKLVIYLPLIYSSVILIYSTIAFLGFSNPAIMQLSTEINNARDMLYSAPWATLWPGFFLFLLVAGPFLLFMGLFTTFIDQLDSLRISEENNLIMK